MEHDGERTEFGGARRAENGVNMFYESAETMGGGTLRIFWICTLSIEKA